MTTEILTHIVHRIRSGSSDPVKDGKMVFVSTSTNHCGKSHEVHLVGPVGQKSKIAAFVRASDISIAISAAREHHLDMAVLVLPEAYLVATQLEDASWEVKDPKGVSIGRAFYCTPLIGEPGTNCITSRDISGRHVISGKEVEIVKAGDTCPRGVVVLPLECHVEPFVYHVIDV